MALSTGRQARLLARTFQHEQIRLGGAYAGFLYELTRRWRQGRLTDKEFITAWIAIEQAGHTQASQHAAQFITNFREAQAMPVTHAAPVLDVFDTGASLGRAVNLIETTNKILRSPLAEARLQRLLQARAAEGHRHVLNAGRDTIEWSTAANGTTWRRVTDGHPCAFCAMLATRDGYLTKESALSVVGGMRGGGRGRRARRRGKRPLGSRYHDYCGCTAVEVLDHWEPTAADRAHQELYEKAREACKDDGLAPTTSNILSKMRELGPGTINDAHTPTYGRRKPGPKTKPSDDTKSAAARPRTQAGGGGGRKPPRRGAGPFKDMPEPPRDPSDGGDRSEWLRYWKERQDALPVDFKGDIVEPHEVVLYERLLRLGEVVTPIKRHVTDPRNDMYWERINAEVENKSAKAKYETIRQRIYSSVKPAKEHGTAPIAKEHFLIDIGHEQLLPELREALSGYNKDRSNFRIKRLFVMHSDGGVIEEIQLL